MSVLFGLVLVALPGGAPPEAQNEAARLPNAYQFPAKWILLESEPNLWLDAGKGELGGGLEAQAGESVWVQDRRTVSDPRTAWLQVRLGEQSGWLPEALLAPEPLTTSAEELAEIGSEPVDRWSGIAPDYVPPNLTKLSGPYEPGVNYRLRKKAAEAYEAMRAAARRDSIELQVVSAYRAYATQLSIYRRKLARSGWNQTTVAKPGHSEHQLGTALDLTDGDESTLLRKSFGESEAGRWLLEWAPAYGFAVSYTKANQSITGYSAEPWHYRYFGLGVAAVRHKAALEADH